MTFAAHGTPEIGVLWYVAVSSEQAGWFQVGIFSASGGVSGFRGCYHPGLLFRDRLE